MIREYDIYINIIRTELVSFYGYDMSIVKDVAYYFFSVRHHHVTRQNI